MKENIIGIQQVGVGVSDVHSAWAEYRRLFGMDVPIFQESAEAKLMIPYTGNTIHSRNAVLAVNLNGGSGMEIWQFTSRTPAAPPFSPGPGDTGIFICKVKSKNVAESHKALRESGAGAVFKDPAGNDSFYLTDRWNNVFQFVEGSEWFRNEKNYHCGGVCGVSIGVSDMDKSVAFYKNLLGYDETLFDATGVFDEFKSMPHGTERYRRVLIKRKASTGGTFARLLGSGQIELIQALDRTPRKIFADRYWGDLGFIHLCFDVYDMKKLEKGFAEAGHPFTVDSSSRFDMGEAAGHFSYIEDPDGTLIEFVETYRIPILKAIGWYLDVSRRDRTKTLPDWMLGALRFNRVKN